MVCLVFEPGTVEWYEQTNLLSYSGPHYIWSFSKKMGQPWPLFRVFSSFQTNITILKTYKCEKMSFQYPAPGFKLTTFWLRVSSLNQWPGLPPLYLIFSLVVEMNINFFRLGLWSPQVEFAYFVISSSKSSQKYFTQKETFYRDQKIRSRAQILK